MCTHTSVKDKVITIEERFGATISNTNLVSIFNKPNYHINGFSHPNMLVIPQQFPKTLAPAVWGIVPNNTASNQIKAYYKNAIKFGGGLNAKAEKLFDHFIYKTSIYSQRCIIPVSGFFESHDFKNTKYPFYIHQKNNAIFGLAGIYTVIDNFITFSIITKPAQPFFAEIHNLKQRQPVILNPNQEQLWLEDQLTQLEIETIVNTTNNTDVFEAYPVSKSLFKPQIDSNVASIITPFVYPELTA